MKRKNVLPLIILQKLAPFVGKETDIYFSELRNKDLLLQVFDKDEKSDFHFFIKEYKKIESVSSSSSGHRVYLEYQPESAMNPNLRNIWIDVNSLDKYFQNWVNLIKQYNETPSFYDDPILENYEKEYFTDFEESFGTEDQQEPFSIQQQLVLDQLFTILKIEISKQSENKTDEQKAQLQIVEQEITELQENIHLTTKAKVISKTSKIFAKISKMGIRFVKELGTEAKKYVIKKIIEGTFDYTKTIDITSYFNQ